MPEIKNNNTIELYADRLFRYAVIRVGDPATAEDLVQETLLAAIEASRGFSGGSSLSTWLIGILKHKIIDHYRRHRVLIDQGCDAGMFDETGHWREAAEPGPWNTRTPEDDVQNDELARILSHAIGALPKPLSTVFAMHEIEGLGREEVCEILGISDSNYWVILHRARLRLRQEVERRWAVGMTDDRTAPLAAACQPV